MTKDDFLREYLQAMNESLDHRLTEIERKVDRLSLQDARQKGAFYIIAAGFSLLAGFIGDSIAGLFKNIT